MGSVTLQPSANWEKCQSEIIKLANISPRKAYNLTVSLRNDGRITRRELLDGIKICAGNVACRIPDTLKQVRRKISEEHDNILLKIKRVKCTETNELARLLRAGQIGQLLSEKEVNKIVSDTINTSLYEASPENANRLLLDVMEYQVADTKTCIKIAITIPERRRYAAEYLYKIGNYSAAKRVASLEYESPLFRIEPIERSDELMAKIIYAEEKLLEQKRKQEEASQRQRAELARILYEAEQHQKQIERERREREEAKRREKEVRKRRNYSSVISRRKIDELIHFTSIENLRTILQFGILPRSDLQNTCPGAIINDAERFDGHMDASCLSVSFPNYRMFYKCKSASKRKWVVLSLDPKLLYDLDIKEFYFYPINAATGTAKRCSFDEMFGNTNDKYPDDVQAEILAFGTIPAKYIKKIYVENAADREYLTEKIGILPPTEVNREYFQPRKEPA